jgi:glycoprotein-N-acetylgalactosamine 3-beta-galactosyltransferase
MNDTSKCEGGSDGSEDVQMGKCLNSVGVRAIDARDALGRYRFHALSATNHLTDQNKWFQGYIKHKIGQVRPFLINHYTCIIGIRLLL